MYAPSWLHTYVAMYTYVYACMYTCAYVCMHASMYKYTYIHITVFSYHTRESEVKQVSFKCINQTANVYIYMWCLLHTLHTTYEYKGCTLT